MCDHGYGVPSWVEGNTPSASEEQTAYTQESEKRLLAGWVGRPQPRSESGAESSFHRRAKSPECMGGGKAGEQGGPGGGTLPCFQGAALA